MIDINTIRPDILTTWPNTNRLLKKDGHLYNISRVFHVHIKLTYSANSWNLKRVTIFLSMLPWLINIGGRKVNSTARQYFRWFSFNIEITIYFLIKHDVMPKQNALDKSNQVQNYSNLIRSNNEVNILLDALSFSYNETTERVPKFFCCIVCGRDDPIDIMDTNSI